MRKFYENSAAYILISFIYLIHSTGVCGMCVNVQYPYSGDTLPHWVISHTVEMDWGCSVEGVYIEVVQWSNYINYGKKMSLIALVTVTSCY